MRLSSRGESTFVPFVELAETVNKKGNRSGQLVAVQFPGVCETKMNETEDCNIANVQCNE